MRACAFSSLKSFFQTTYVRFAELASNLPVCVMEGKGHNHRKSKLGRNGLLTASELLATQGHIL